MRAVARRFATSLSTVQRWVAHAEGKRLDRVDFSDTSHVAHTIANKTAEPVEQKILTLRSQLAKSILGEIGAEAIAAALRDDGIDPIPSTRTINRILARNGVFDVNRRIRRPAPPPGWYLPEVAGRDSELDAIDIVEGLVLKGGPDIQVLNLMSLHGGRPGSFVAESLTARSIVEHLLAHWKRVGRPDYAQFDNDTRFHGPHHFPDVIGRISRLCLQLQITPVFAAQREHGPQNAIESYNGLWQARVWSRQIYQSIEELSEASDRYVAARSQKNAWRIDAAPERHPLAGDWRFDPECIPGGRIIYLRRTDDTGAVVVLGQKIHIDSHWVHRLVRCELDLTQQIFRAYALRRATPGEQKLLLEKEHPITLKPIPD